jgi:hypothetical protein
VLHEVTAGEIALLVMLFPRLAGLDIVGVEDPGAGRGADHGPGPDGVGGLPPGRDGDVLADWLKAHPGTGVICRDRAGGYANYTPTCGKSRKQSRKPPRPAAGRNATSPRTRSWNSSRTSEPKPRIMLSVTALAYP